MSRSPLAVTWKYLLALPPRSAVGSPSAEDTRPFCSSRSKAKYTLPSATSRPLAFSIVTRMEEPILLVPHLDDDVHDVEGLLRVHRYLFASDAESERLIADVIA